MKKLLSCLVLSVMFSLACLPLAAMAQDAKPEAPAAEAAAEPAKPDPTGATLGTAADIIGYAANAPTKEELAAMSEKEPLAAKAAEAAGKNKISINFVWTLVCGFLVMFMQLGFALAETGFTRAKNAAHTMTMNFMVYGIGMLGYWLTGYALQMGGAGPFVTLGGGGTMDTEFAITLFGKDFGLFGLKGFLLGGDAYDVAIFTMFLFQMVFMDTAVTIPTGSMAERWTFKSFVIYGFYMSMFIYPLYANWVWGGGWLSTLGKNFSLGHGVVDFAGSSVVHMTGGVAALAGAICLGPRLGKYGPGGKVNAIPGHHIPMAIAGCLILAFGWFGFNAGSTLAGSDLRIGIVATNTMLASAAGSFSALLYMWLVYGKPDASMAANGLLAALVAITAPCAFVNASSAIIIGLIAGVLLCVSVFFVDRTLKVDDPVGAISVHGVNGAWGLLAVGIFADGTYGDALNTVEGTVKGLLYGDSGQFMAQCIGVLTNFIFVFVAFFVFFKVLNVFVKLRVSPEIERDGLDEAEVGVTAYPDFSVNKTHR
ncbi:ammonium transporter [Fundidesulfovibrio agrisoli]|uniref:ammonium transporter n=1 Tax=Fundidesulfovibrio agrisoli TaxID=2922717 RepID=UPI001FABD233|nr:ammonium transporter [Fundidesulfovibrio agrisoli]